MLTQNMNVDGEGGKKENLQAKERDVPSRRIHLYLNRLNVHRTNVLMFIKRKERKKLPFRSHFVEQATALLAFSTL